VCANKTTLDLTSPFSFLHGMRVVLCHRTSSHHPACGPRLPLSRILSLNLLQNIIVAFNSSTPWCMCQGDRRLAVIGHHHTSAKKVSKARTCLVAGSQFQCQPLRPLTRNNKNPDTTVWSSCAAPTSIAILSLLQTQVFSHCGLP
jgi:hypothetical protein